MTGELFSVLGRHSLLQHSVGESTEPLTSLAGEDFVAGVEHAIARPLSTALFRVRTRDVLDGLPAAGNLAFLSGVLVGGELAHLVHDPAPTPLVLAATEPLATSYRLALAHLGAESRLTTVPPDDVELLSARGQSVLLSRLLD
jgi:2-dehydro-3-deoxygalactonokinase